jgi:hypothetical protein
MHDSDVRGSSSRLAFEPLQRALIAGSLAAVVALVAGAGGGVASKSQGLYCINPTGISVTTDDAAAQPFGSHILAKADAGTAFAPLLFTESGAIGSAYYVWTATWHPSDPGLKFGFEKAPPKTQQSEADAQVLDGTLSKPGAYTVKVSLREDPGATAVAGSQTALSWPNGQLTCPATTESYSVVVERPIRPTYDHNVRAAEDEAHKSALALHLWIVQVARPVLESLNAEARWKEYENQVLADLVPAEKDAGTAAGSAPAQDDAKLKEARTDLVEAIDTVTGTTMKMIVSEEPSKTFAPDLTKAENDAEAAAALLDQVM